MSQTDSKKLQKSLNLLANENKFKIIQLLSKGEVCVCDIGDKLDIEQSLVSHHLNSLRKVGLVKDRRLGNWIHCSLDKDEFSKMFNLFSTYFSPEVISDKTCIMHEKCKCLINN